MGATHHDGVSVYGSGYMVGKKSIELTLMPDSGLQRMDGGKTAFLQSVVLSTNLSSINYVFANIMQSSLTFTSALGNVQVNWSSNSVGLYTGTAATSGIINWLAIGT
jgi:hypothetical protein